MKKQKVFIPVDVEKELPIGNDFYHTIDVKGEPNCRTPSVFKDFDEDEVKYWLKEQEGYFFTESQMQEFIKDSRNSLINSVTKFIQSLTIK